MTLQSSTLRPGLLVSLKTSLKGNVSYTKQEIEADHFEADGSKCAKWETERKIADAEEHERATTARDAATHLVRKVCSATTFGYLCPEANSDKLEAAIKEARAVADDFNATATITRLGFYVVTGRVAPDDVEAVRAINSEVRDLVDTMSEGIRNLNAKAVRAAATKAKSLGQMLSQDASDKIKDMVKLARETATAIVKAGVETAQEIDLVTIRRLNEARTAFLDLGDTAEISMPTEVGRGVDLTPDDEVIKPAAVTTPKIELAS